MCTTVMAVPEPKVQINEGVGTLEITYPKVIYYELGQNFTLYYHVFNSTGSMVTNADCMFHLYNDSNGKHLVEQYLELDGNNMEYEYKVDQALFKDQGTYATIVYCNNSEAGFLSTEFFITKDGQLVPDDLSIPFAAIIIPLVISLLLMIGSFTLGETHNIFKIFLFLFSLVPPLWSFNYAIETFGYLNTFGGITDLIASHVSWYGILFSVILMYYLIQFIIWAVKTIATNKQEEFEY